MRRFLASTLLVLAIACDHHDHESVTAEGARVEVLSASGDIVQSVTVTPSSVPTTPLSLSRGVPATIRVTWLNAAGASDPVNADVSFFARFTPPSGSGLSAARIPGSRSMVTMTGATLQAAAVRVPLALFHEVENHADLDVVVPVIVVPAPT